MNLPMLDLQTREGAPFPWPEVWQRQNLLVLFAHPSCEPCRKVLVDWNERATELAAENTRPLAIFTGEPAEAPPGITILLDPDERLAGQLGVSQGTALAADRFFEILAREDVHGLGADAAASDSIDWVRLAERRCDECGVGTW